METGPKKPLFGAYINNGGFVSNHVSFYVNPGIYDAAKIGPECRFVTNRAINRELRKMYEEHPEKIPHIHSGAIGIDIVAGKKLIATSTFEPLPSMRGNDGIHFNILEKTGLGTLAELAMEKMLLEKHPDFLIASTSDPRINRIIQLEGRGRLAGYAMPLKEAYERTRLQVQAQYRKNKPQAKVEHVLREFKIFPSQKAVEKFREEPIEKLKKMKRTRWL